MSIPLPGKSWVRVAGLLVAAVAISGCGATSASPAAPDAGVGTALDRQLPGAIETLPLRDPSGHRVTLGSFGDKTVVISDSMTLCSEDCPLDTANIVAAARAADSAGLTSKVEFLTITVDPSRDNARHLTAYRKLYDAAGRLRNWQLLTGSQRQITRLWKYFGVYWHRVPQGNPPPRDWLTGRPLTYDVQHADEVLLLDPHGHWRFEISGHANVPVARAVPARMRGFLSPQGHRHLGRPGAAAWTPDDVLQAVAWLTGRQIPTP
jgi:cytochrome oxidase Cu insertion factor (SCO1/SenC/PrrC family)